MKRLVVIALALCLVAALATEASAQRRGGGVYRGGSAAVRGPACGAAVRGPAGNVAVPRSDQRLWRRLPPGCGWGGRGCCGGRCRGGGVLSAGILRPPLRATLYAVLSVTPLPQPATRLRWAVGIRLRPLSSPCLVGLLLAAGKWIGCHAATKSEGNQA
jgi:hypothetical protein